MFSFQSYPQYFQFITNGKKPHPKSKFTPAEDEKLRMIVKEVGENSWNIVSKRMGNRNQRQCKERWFNYLSPNVQSLPWTLEEDQKLVNLHDEYGAKWVKISQFFPSRTDTNIKNRWMVLQRQKKRKLRKNSKKENNFENQTSTVSSPEINQHKEVEIFQEEITGSKINFAQNEKVESFNIFDEQFDLSFTEYVNDQFNLDYFY